MSADVRHIVGSLLIRPGATPAIRCERPMVGATLMRRLIDGRPASALPDAIAALFTLCASTQRQTAQRALRAARGDVDRDDDARTLDRLALSVFTAREHLQRLALELPLMVPRDGVPIDAAGVRDAPVFRLPSQPDKLALTQAVGALGPWLQQHLLGMAPERWLNGWQQDAPTWLAAWAERQAHPVARWLTAVRDQARALTIECRRLDALDDAQAGMAALAASLAESPAFAERPLWRGAPAETGPWTRAGHVEAVHTLWDRLGARLADLLRIACGERLACGALALAPGEGVAWSEMSRGLLVHWVKLAPGARSADGTHAERYQVLAPTEWNFHPDGALGRALASGRIDAAGARLATAVLDPCVAFHIETEAGHA